MSTSDIRVCPDHIFATVHGDKSRKLAEKFGVRIGHCHYWFTPNNWEAFQDKADPFMIRDWDKKEVFCDHIVKRRPARLIVTLIGIALVFGLDRTEAAINNTYARHQADMIITLINNALENRIHHEN